MSTKIHNRTGRFQRTALSIAVSRQAIRWLAMLLLNDYNWPGNVRELQNTIERTVILCRNELVRAADIQLSSLGSRSSAPPVDRPPAGGYRELSMADIEQEHILATLEHTGWNKSRASQILGIERSTLDRKLKRYHVPKPLSD